MKRFHRRSTGPCIVMATISTSRLILALQSGEIVPYFQPQIELKTGSLSGFEVLARWLHPELGILLPAEFIPLAQGANLLPDVTHEVLGQATVAIAAFCPMPLRLSINISADELLDPELCERLSLIAECSGFPISCLTLELTESTRIENTALARATVHRIRRSGFRLSLDDFGKGYAGLQHLHEIPFDELKIDMRFVQCISEYQRSEDFIAGVIALGEALGIHTVAEGIETHIQANLLTSLQCELGQGFLFGAPVPASSIPALMMERTARKENVIYCANAGQYRFEIARGKQRDSPYSDCATAELRHSDQLPHYLEYPRSKPPHTDFAGNSQMSLPPLSIRRSFAPPPQAQKQRAEIAAVPPSVATGNSTGPKEEKTLQNWSSQLLKAQEEERRRIARELHDSVLQLHALLSLNLDKISSESLDRTSRNALEDTKALVTICSEELRTISYLLHPPFIEDLGLESALRIFVEGLTRRTDIDIRVQIATPLPRFDSDLELALFRVVQESLSNILRHSGSSWAEIRIQIAADLVLEVEDHGKGLPATFYDQSQSHAHMGVGIAGMRERIRPFGGTIELLPANPGLLVRAVVPKVAPA
ncbi:MAG TPA: hypothetical protein DGA22_03765 [Acidobacterium sp.]|nr:hypothetical protein [Acidobacterium sp.]